MREVQANPKRFSYLNNHHNKQNSDEFGSLLINLWFDAKRSLVVLRRYVNISLDYWVRQRGHFIY